MFFDNDIDVIEIPERVYELAKLICDRGTVEDSELKALFQPQWKEDGSSNYFPHVRDAVIELNLATKEGSTIHFTGDKSCLKSIDAFRRFCNSFVWKNNNTYFYNIAKAFIDSDDQWLSEKNVPTSNKVKNAILDIAKIPSWDSRYILGERFWISFLGYGYVDERNNAIQILPNMYVALRDLISLSSLENGKEYSLREFFDAIRVISPLGLPESHKKQISLACSCGLRLLNDTKEAQLARHPDAGEVWHLFKFENHKFQEEITHITIKGVK